MKAKELIKFIQDRNLEEFDMEFHYCYIDERGINIDGYSIDEIGDVGYSDKVIILDGSKMD